MKEELQQIQAVALVTFLCVLISIHSTGEYGEWFEVSGTKQEILDPGNPENGTSSNQFEYSYHMNYYTYYQNGETSKENYESSNCNSCVEKSKVVQNITRLAYATAVLAIGVAYMARDSINHLHKKNLRKSLTNLKYSAILVLILGLLTTSMYYMEWTEALKRDEAAINNELGETQVLGCITDVLTFYGGDVCLEYVSSQNQGESDLLSARINPISWGPGIGFFVVVLGSMVTGGGTLYILGSIDEEWQAILKKQDLIERQQKIQDGEIDKNKELLQEFEDTEQKLKDAEKRIEDVRNAADEIDYQGIEDLDNELDRLTALNQSVETLNNSLDGKLKTARLATSEVEKRARMAEKELNDDLAAKNNLEKEIDDLRDKHENDMRLSDRMTREISSLRKMSEEAEERAIKAEKKLKIEKPDTINALESYDSVKAAYDKTVEEKNNLEKEIMEYEQQTLESNEREKSADTERKEAAKRRKDLDQEVKLMEKNKKRINDKFTTLTSSLEKAKKDLATAREKASVTLSELDIERETIVELQQDSEKFRAREGEIVELTDSLKELQEQVKDQKDTNKGVEDDLRKETDRKRKTEKDLRSLEKASEQVSKVMESLKKQFDAAKDELNIAVDDRNKAERLLETERTEHEKLKEDLEFLQGATIGSEEDTERKIKAMNIETPKAQEEAREMKEEADNLSEQNQDLEAKIKEARLGTIDAAVSEDEKDKEETENTADIAGIGTSLLVKNLAKETEHNFQLVNPDDADPKTGKLPLTNPIAKALEGTKEGDEVSVGPNTFKVIKLN